MHLMLLLEASSRREKAGFEARDR